MPDDSVKTLRDAASIAHRHGDTETAVALYEKILDLFPDSTEAVDAVFYLTSIGKGRRHAPKRVSTEVPDETESGVQTRVRK